MQSQRLDIVELIEQNPITKLSENYQGKFIQKIQENFTGLQQKLVVASFYCYLNYNSKTDFVIELESIWKWLGFSRKDPAKVVLLKHFILDIDYKIITNELCETEVAPEVAGAGITTKKLGGAGQNKEKIVMTINTFKKLCLKSNTKKADEIHDYFIKLEEITQMCITEESQELKNQLQDKINEMQLLELNLEEKDHKINLMTRKVNKFNKGESVYIFHSTIQEDNKVVDLYKLGRTKYANVRDTVHKTASYKGILLQVDCVDSVLLERNLHFLLNKYRKTNRREWFTCTFDIMKNAIDYAKYVLENNIDFENFKLDNVKIPIKQNIQVENKIDNTEKFIKDKIEDTKPFFTNLERIHLDIDNFDLFVNEHFEFSETKFISHITLKNQYKIWSKTANHSQLKKLIEHVKTKYISFMYKANDLVSTSKLTLHFRGISLKQTLLNFEKPVNEKLIIENYLYHNCQRASGFRVTMQELFNDFEIWYKTLDKTLTFSHLIKEKVKTYLDVKFIRLRSGDESNGKDNRLGGWLGFALKINQIPEPIKKYKPKNAKVIFQKNLNNETIKEWNSVSELAFYLKKSNTVTSSIVNYHKPLIIDEIQYSFEFK